MRIRRLSKTDAAEYQSLLLRGVQEHPKCFRISSEDVLNQPTPLEDGSESDVTLGACDDHGRLIGIVSLRREQQSKFRHKALLYRMFVASEAAGQGAGRALIQEAIRAARNMAGLELINLTVIASNTRAKALYAAEGFVSFSREKNATKADGVYFDEEQMALELRS